MENPATWGEAEHVIQKALASAEIARRAKVFGLSTPRRIADALREAGLLADQGTVLVYEPGDEVTTMVDREFRKFRVNNDGVSIDVNDWEPGDEERSR